MHAPGESVDGRYRIVRLLGQGAFGATYEAEPTAGGARVALKALGLRALDDWKAFELFEREAAVLATLAHPGIPRMIEAFRTDVGGDARFYLVQSLVDGSSLADLVARGFAPGERQIVRIAREVLGVLAYLHGRTPPVIHRDIKPENLVRDASGAIRLVDFGAVQAGFAETLVVGSTVAGTFGYMPPEQYRGKAVAASDLFALGSTLVFLIARTPPADLPHKKNRLDLRALPVSPHLRRWLARMTAPALEDRFASATEALAALDPPAGTRRAAYVAGATAIAVAAPFIVGFHAGGPSEPPREKARAAHTASAAGDELRYQAPDESRPLGAWRFDQGCAGGRVTGPGGLDARLVGAVQCDADGALFHGDTARFEIDDRPALHLTRALTLAAWVKPARVNGLQTIVNKWYALDAYMLLVSNGRYAFSLARPGGGQWGTSHEIGAPATPEVWATVVGVYDGKQMRLFVDGEKVAEAPFEGPLQDSTRPVVIGSHPDWNAYSGAIREVRIYREALDDERVRALR